MNAQEVFDKVVNHLRQQGKKSQGLVSSSRNAGDTFCMYRNPEGLKCAVGALIEEDEYSPSFELHLLCELLRMELPDSLRERLAGNYNLIVELQEIHDHSSVEYWENAFKRLAEHENLNYTPKESS